MTDKRPLKDREAVRYAFRRAANGLEPDVSRLTDAVPAMMAEARRRRMRAEQVDSISAVVPLARRVIPRLAAAAAALVLVATVFGVRDASETGNGTASLDSLILTSEIGEGASDVLLEALTDTGDENG
jgi:hypothetical protein